jgi:hypothetical protein
VHCLWVVGFGNVGLETFAHFFRLTVVGVGLAGVSVRVSGRGELQYLHIVLGRDFVPTWSAFFACTDAIYLFCLIILDH